MKILEKRERALGARLFLKADRCNSPKCAASKRPYKPGPHAKSFKKLSEYGRELLEKQKVRFSYGLTERQLEKYFVAADRGIEPTHEVMIKLLESRLDNAVFRAGLAASRRIGKQLVSHGHIMVNGRKVTIPSYSVKPDDLIAIRPESASGPMFSGLDEKFKNFEAPEWLKLDKEKRTALVIMSPKGVEAPFDMDLVVNYYLK
ncbi:MAG: 30S ribosomal protein S4 [Parcubacteria group bacterium]